MAKSDLQRDFLIARIAELHFSSGIRQKEIADRYGVSPMQVSRLIKEGFDRGIISVQIKAPIANDLELAKKLQQAYQLKDAFVIDAQEDADRLAVVAQAAAYYLMSLLHPGSTLAVAWGKTLAAVIEYLPATRIPDLKVVQIVGGPSSFTNTHTHPYEVCRRIGSTLGGDIYPLHAPALVASPSLRDELLREESIKNVFNLARAADCALISIGPVSERSTFHESGFVSKEELADLARRDAAGEILGQFIDKDGNQIEWSRGNCYIGLDLRDLLTIPTRIAVVASTDKLDSLAAILKAGYINVPVVDTEIARGLLGGL